MPTRNEILADHFMKVTGIAAVYADAAGAIGAVDVIGIDAPPGSALLCCAPGKQAAIAARAGVNRLAKFWTPIPRLRGSILQAE
jgi:hypothetical protein